MFNTLNKYLIFLLTAILLITIGCEEDETDTGPIPEVPFNFIGTWLVSEWRDGEFYASTHSWHVYEDGTFLYSEPDGVPDRESRYYYFCDDAIIGADTLDIFHTNYNNNKSSTCTCDLQEAWTIEYKGRDKFELTDCYGERPRWELTRQSLIP